jgi:hypothetical protein
MAILTSVLKSLELFLLLKNKLFYYEIRTKSLNRQKEIIAEIENLRSKGDSNSADRADLLRSELRRERQELEHLSTFYAKTGEGKGSTNP